MKEEGGWGKESGVLAASRVSTANKRWLGEWVRVWANGEQVVTSLCTFTTLHAVVNEACYWALARTRLVQECLPSQSNPCIHPPIPPAHNR
jgi:hypothetical protein